MAKSPKQELPGASVDDADYIIGYGKPPTSGQFKKGQSGNPSGGSGKARARTAARRNSPFEQIMLDESVRPVSITENGKRTKTTTFRAISRSLMIDAAKGNRSAHKLVIDRVSTAHDRQKAATNERFGLLVQYVVGRAASQDSPTPSAFHNEWPHHDDVILDYINCVGEVVGPIDSQQAEPFIALVADYRTWQARLDQLQSREKQAEGEVREMYVTSISAVIGLLVAIRRQLPPSFTAQLAWSDGEISSDAMEINDPCGGSINLLTLPNEGAETSYAMQIVAFWARRAVRDIAGPARLNIAANTTSLINRVQIERQNRDAGVAPPPKVPDFGTYYGEFSAEDLDALEEVAT